MKYAYDFHIHTALSPCANEDMTPNNIVNMARLKELDMIAITDHNTGENVKAVMKVAEETNLLVIPGMEVETSEEIHVVCLFPDLETTQQMQQIVYENLPTLKNRKEIFGSQYVLDENDDVIGENERLLLTATKISIYDVMKYVKDLGGVAIPAHIDRNSYSIITNLGWIPEDLPVSSIEISKNADYKHIQAKYPNFHIVQSSDAHYLQDIFEREHFLEIDNNTAESVIEFLKKSK